MLTEWEIQNIIGCAGAAWLNQNGSLDGGTVGPSDCGHEILFKAFNSYTIKEFGKTMEDIVESLMKTLPIGEAILEAKEISDILHDLLDGDTESAADKVMESLSEELRKHLPSGFPEDDLDKIVDELYKKKVGAAKGDCAQIDLSWSHNTTKPNPNKHGLDCDLVVCGTYDVKGDLNYTVQGSCDYTCTGTPCCCGAKKTFSMSQSGKRMTSWGFGSCEHNTKKVSW